MPPSVRIAPALDLVHVAERHVYCTHSSVSTRFAAVIVEALALADLAVGIGLLVRHLEAHVAGRAGALLGPEGDALYFDRVVGALRVHEVRAHAGVDDVGAADLALHARGVRRALRRRLRSSRRCRRARRRSARCRSRRCSSCRGTCTSSRRGPRMKFVLFADSPSEIIACPGGHGRPSGSSFVSAAAGSTRFLHALPPIAKLRSPNAKPNVDHLIIVILS